MSLQNPFQSLSQVCLVGQNDFRSKLRRSVVLLLLSIFNYPFRITIQQESSFHVFQFAVQVLGCGGKFFGSLEKSVDD